MQKDNDTTLKTMWISQEDGNLKEGDMLYIWNNGKQEIVRVVEKDNGKLLVAPNSLYLEFVEKRKKEEKIKRELEKTLMRLL